MTQQATNTQKEQFANVFSRPIKKEAPSAPKPTTNTQALVQKNTGQVSYKEVNAAEGFGFGDLIEPVPVPQIDVPQYDAQGAPVYGNQAYFDFQQQNPDEFYGEQMGHGGESSAVREHLRAMSTTYNIPDSVKEGFAKYSQLVESLDDEVSQKRLPKDQTAHKGAHSPQSSRSVANHGSWCVREIKNKGGTQYSVIEENSGICVATKIKMRESAEIIAKLFAKGYCLPHPDLLYVIENEEKYSEMYKEAKNLQKVVMETFKNNDFGRMERAKIRLDEVRKKLHSLQMQFNKINKSF